MEKAEDKIFDCPRVKLEEKDERDGTADEKKKLTLMKAALQNKDPSCKEVDESTMRRFLRARDDDVEKASTMLAKFLNWRRTFVPNGSISESEVTNEIAQKKMFAQGIDKLGRPISVVFGSRHFHNKKGGLDEFRRFLVFALDKLCQRMPDGQEKFTIIGDLQGYGYCNSDFRANLAALTILQEYYPERLGKLFIVHAPYVFMAMWKIVYPCIDKNTKKKIVFVDDKKLKETLLEDIDEAQLPQIYGGQLQLLPIQNA